jgi:hypothetical protein
MSKTHTNIAIYFCYNRNINLFTFVVLTSEKMLTVVVLLVTCILVKWYKRFERTQPTSSGWMVMWIKIEGIRSSETLVTAFKTRRYLNPEGHIRHRYISLLADVGYRLQLFVHSFITWIIAYIG